MDAWLEGKMDGERKRLQTEGQKRIDRWIDGRK